MFVPGAMAAIFAAIVMKTPAEAARAPVGATYTMTGMGEPRMVCTIERIERSSPPGVLSWTIRACAPSFWARSSAIVSKRTVTGVMAPSISMEATGGGAAAAGPAVESSAARPSRMAAMPRRGRRVADLTASS